jgi:hypothetical protein
MFPTTFYKDISV